MVKKTMMVQTKMDKDVKNVHEKRGEMEKNGYVIKKVTVLRQSQSQGVCK